MESNKNKVSGMGQLLNFPKPDKSNLVLDFDAKKKKSQGENNAPLCISTSPSGTIPCMLNSPDLQMLKLKSPEIERMILNYQGNTMQTPTPGLNWVPVVNPKSISSETEDYARGCVEYLSNFLRPEEAPSEDRKKDHLLPSLPGCNYSQGSSYTLTKMTDVNTVNIKQNITPKIVQADVSSSYSIVTQPRPFSRNNPTLIPSSTPLNLATSIQNNTVVNNSVSIKLEPDQGIPEDSLHDNNNICTIPLDSTTQERIKQERKRLRNRIAASKCRRRKLEKISLLEESIKELKHNNNNLVSEKNKLRAQLAELKQKVMNHVNSGCQVMLTPTLSGIAALD